MYPDSFSQGFHLYGDVCFTVALPKWTKNNENQKFYTKKEINFFNVFKSLQNALNRSESLPDGFEWIRMYPNDLWRPKNPKKSRENDRKSQKNFEKFAKTCLKKSFFVININFVQFQ